MTVNTKEVIGRRALRFANLDQMLADAERCAAGPCRTLGNWAPGQILGHLSRVFHLSIDGVGFWAPWPVRFYLRLFTLPKFLKRGMTPGIQFPPAAASRLVVPADTSAEDGRAALEAAVARYRDTPERAAHPVFGRLSDAKWTELHLRHAELHLSFIVPES